MLPIHTLLITPSPIGCNLFNDSLDFVVYNKFQLIMKCAKTWEECVREYIVTS